ncbi:MAG TPA: conjugative transfer protein MobI(A/C) [Lamprocystis sp. (in: g-proteobacteria)]|nr:conjugative transfer protein MobI(A/C) [Lamprocystis sp. (in: g-proteobacteria)]
MTRHPGQASEDLLEQADHGRYVPQDRSLERLTAADIDAWCRGHMVRLREYAEAQAMHFQAAVREEAKDLPRSQKGRLSVRIRDQRAERATPGAFTIEWVKIRYGNSPTQGVLCFSEYLPKGEGDRYPASAFRDLAIAWQRPLVYATEDAFAKIRRSIRLVAQTRVQYRAAEKHLAELFARPVY